MCRSLSVSPTKLNRRKAQVIRQTHTQPHCSAPCPQQQEHREKTLCQHQGDVGKELIPSRQNSTYLIGVGYRLSQLIYVKYLAICLAHSTYSINVTLLLLTKHGPFLEYGTDNKMRMERNMS